RFSFCRRSGDICRRRPPLQLPLNLPVAVCHQGSAAGRIHALNAARSFDVMKAARQSRRLGIIGCAAGLLALLVSALTQLLPDALLHKPIYQVTETAGQSSKDHLVFRIKRLEIRSSEASGPRTAAYTWNQGLSTAAVSLGLLAIAFAVFAVILREEK